MTTVDVTIETASGQEAILPNAFTYDEPPAPSDHAYYDTLAARPDCVVAEALRSQAELDEIETGAFGARLPVKYDPLIDAALFTIHAPTTPDSQQKLINVQGLDMQSLLMTWDFTFDESYRWHPETIVVDGQVRTYIGGHKTWRYDAGTIPWLALKTSYKATGSNRPELAASYIAEFYLSTQAGKFVGTGTIRASDETLHPRHNFPRYLRPNVWTRLWVLFEDTTLPECAISMWIADEQTDPVHLYDRLKMIIPPARMTKFRFEWDSSAPPGINPDLLLAWNRNVVILQGVTLADMPALLQRPVSAASSRYLARWRERVLPDWWFWLRHLHGLRP